MDALLQSELGHENVERGVEDSNNGGRTNDGSVFLRQFADENAKVQVSRLLLSETSGVLLDVAGLRHFRHGFGVERELDVRDGCDNFQRVSQIPKTCQAVQQGLTTEQNGLQLTVHHDVGVPPDRTREMSVQRKVESVVVVLGDVEHAGTEVLGALHRLGAEVLQRESFARVGDVGDGVHQSPGGRPVETDVETLHAVDEGVLRARERKRSAQGW